jgi:hypothetical protein
MSVEWSKNGAMSRLCSVIMSPFFLVSATDQYISDDTCTNRLYVLPPSYPKHKTIETKVVCPPDPELGLKSWRQAFWTRA